MSDERRSEGGSDPREQVTRLLNRLREGDAAAGDALYPVLHEELRQLARGMIGGEQRGRTLDATALVHEAWIKLGPTEAGEPVRGRAQFFAHAAAAMRSVLVDHARATAALKRGGDRDRTPLEGLEDPLQTQAETYLAVDEALARIAERDLQAAQLAELRLFGGLEHGEIAEVLGTSLRSVERGWRFARAQLRRELGEGVELG